MLEIGLSYLITPCESFGHAESKGPLQQGLAISLRLAPPGRFCSTHAVPACTHAHHQCVSLDPKAHQLMPKRHSHCA